MWRVGDAGYAVVKAWFVVDLVGHFVGDDRGAASDAEPVDGPVGRKVEGEAFENALGEGLIVAAGGAGLVS